MPSDASGSATVAQAAQTGSGAATAFYPASGSATVAQAAQIGSGAGTGKGVGSGSATVAHAAQTASGLGTGKGVGSGSASVTHPAQTGSGLGLGRVVGLGSASVVQAAQAAGGSGLAITPSISPGSPLTYLEDGLTLRVTLAASETLQVISDFYGVPGYVSLLHIDSLTRYSMAVVEVAAVTPEIPQDVYRGEREGATLPFGEYRVEALLVDPAGNRRVLGAVTGQRASDPVGAVEFRFFKRRERRWFRLRSLDRSTKFRSADRSTKFRSRPERFG